MIPIRIAVISHQRYHIIINYIPHTVHFIPVTHLFYNLKFVPLNLSHLFLSTLHPYRTTCLFFVCITERAWPGSRDSEPAPCSFGLGLSHRHHHLRGLTHGGPVPGWTSSLEGLTFLTTPAEAKGSRNTCSWRWWPAGLSFMKPYSRASELRKKRLVGRE